MKKQLISLLAFTFILLGFSVNAQEKNLTYADASWMNYEIFPERVSSLQWMGDTDYFTYNTNNAVIKAKANSKKRDTILRISDINDALVKVGEKAGRSIPRFRWVDNNNLRFKKGEKYFTYNLATKKATLINEIPAEAENIDFFAKSGMVAYTLGNNLFVQIDGKKVAVTGDKSEFIQNGASDIHRNEFGISKGTFWSPNSEKLAFYRMDEGMVSNYPLVDITTRVAEENATRYPMAGMKSHHVTVGVYNIITKETIFLETGEPKEQYLTNVSWSPDGEYIFIAVINREQNHMWFNQYNANNGEKIATLFEEKNERYVEPQTPAIFLPKSNTQFVWQSRRDGFNHLYLYNIKGEFIKQITKGDWLVTGVEGFTPKGNKIFYTSTEASPLQNNLYSVEIKSGKTIRLTPDHGTHRTQTSYSGKYILDQFSSTDVVAAVKVEDSRGKVVQELLNSKNPLENYNMGEMTIGKILGENGDSLYYRLIKPTNFDPNKKYPSLVYVYGGPHAQMITDSWLGGAGFWLNLLAQKGFVIMTVDNHGSANRGFEFESCIHRQVGEIEMKDQIHGVDFLKTHSWVDADRIGVDGWSYGGFMTINLLVSYPEVFKAGCAGGPVCDWKYYEIMYGERYMDTPQENPEGYENSCVINKADKLEDQLLIIHGTSDPVVVWQHSLSFIQKCIEENIQVDYFVYPGHEHNVSGKDRMHLLEKITRYFEVNL